MILRYSRLQPLFVALTLIVITSRRNRLVFLAISMGLRDLSPDDHEVLKRRLDRPC